jgi:hypothetical protein
LEQLANRVAAEQHERRTKGDGPNDWPPLLMHVILAHHLGAIQPRESIAEGYARALGYPKSKILDDALQHAVPDVQRRHEAAVHQLFDHHGCDRDTASARDVSDVLAVLLEDVPQAILDRAGGRACRRAGHVA